MCAAVLRHFLARCRSAKQEYREEWDASSAQVAEVEVSDRSILHLIGRAGIGETARSNRALENVEDLGVLKRTVWTKQRTLTIY